MQTHPYVFRRGGEIVAKLDSNGEFHSNADGAGWFSYDSLLDFFQDAGVEIHPTEYITQVAELTNALPEIDLAAMQAGAATAQAPLPAPIPTPKPKRGRAAKAPAGVEAQAPTPTVLPTPIPQAGTPAPTANPLQDPAVQAFLASQRAAAANNPPLPVPVAAAVAPPIPVEVPVSAPVPAVEVVAPAPVMAPVKPKPPAAAPAPAPVPVQLPTSPVSAAVDALIQTHGIQNVAGAFVQWATTGADAAEKYGLVETAKRLRGVANAHQMAQGL